MSTLTSTPAATMPTTPLLAAGNEYSTVAVLVLVVVGLALAILLLTHLIGPRRHGAIKESTYESGMTPVGDARRRFNVRFYLVAVLFLVFDVEVIFLYPWAVLFGQTTAAADAPVETSAAAGPAVAGGGVATVWPAELTQAGFGSGFMLAAIGIFFALLLVGFVYEWRKGVFRWD